MTAHPSPAPTPYDAAGGAAAMHAWAAAFHRLALEDPELHHPFSRTRDPRHVELLAAYWGEVLGGPRAFTALGSDHSRVLRLHLGESGGADLAAMRRAFVACAVAAWRAAGLPDDGPLVATVRAYLEWAVAEMTPEHDDPERVPDGLPMPRWGWNGPLHPPVERGRGGGTP